MQLFVTVVHVIVCLLLILIVLLQAGRGGIGGAFGGGFSQTTFGVQRGNILTKTTTILAGIFVVTSLTLTFYSMNPTTIKVTEKPAAELADPGKKKKGIFSLFKKKEEPKEQKTQKDDKKPQTQKESK
jgi:preprotein translocase subunit SecG